MQSDILTSPAINLDDVVHRAECRAECMYQNKQVANTYIEFLTAAVTDIAILPVEREFAGVPPIDTEDEISMIDTLRRIVSIAAITFNRPLTQTEHDLVDIMKEYPTVDVREAAERRKRGLLH